MITHICQNCQTQLVDDDKFCPQCGSAQNQAPKKNKKCQNCNHENLLSAAFCENCGAPLSDEQVVNEPLQAEPNKIVSEGSYSGTMTKSKSKFGKRLRYAIFIIVALGAVALIIWFQLDENAGEKLSNFAIGLLFVAVFVFFIFRAAKKGKYKGRRRGFGGGNRNDDYDDDNYDYNDDDNDDDDGGDDD